MAVADVRWAQPCLLAVALLALLLGAASGQEPGGPYRLPGEVTPEHYDLKIVPFLETGNYRFSGTVDITVTAVKNPEHTSPRITLHAHKDLAVSSATVTEIDTQTVVELADIETAPTYEWCILMLKTPLNIGSKYLLTLQFSGPLKKDNHGFYLSSYAIDGGFEYMATTHFEATSARKAFPCFDEPGYRTTFDISVAKLDDQIALSNMPVESTSDYDPDQGNRRWVKFQTTPKMPTYLVAFIVSKLQKVPTANENINIYVRRNAVDGVSKAVEVAPKLLSALETFTGVQYPLPKLDLVAIPDFPSGAMENWGLITYKEDMLLVTANVSTADRTATSLRVVAHEFAHLWFGDLVTLKWWNTIWQQEGMAAFLESYIVDKATDGDYDLMSRLGTTRVQTALDVDAREHSVPLTKNDIDSPDSIEDHFGTITYSKGCNIHFMLMNVLGESVYRSGLREYLTSNAYTSTDINDFAKALQKAVDDAGRHLPGAVTVQQLVDSWGNQIGYPVLTVHRDYQKSTASVSQARFLSHEPADKSAADTKWLVPYAVNSLYGKQDTFTQVLPDDGSVATVTDMPTPTVLAYINRAQNGYYRVNYDMHNWMLLANGASRLEPATRASLIDDLFALNRRGLVDTWLPFFYLEKTLSDTSNSGERDIAPWLTAAKVIRGFAALSRADKELATYYQIYITKMLTTAFEAVGFESDFDMDYNRFKKSVVRDVLTQLACEAGMPECRRKALAASKTISVVDGKIKSDPNVYAATLCEAAKTFDLLSLEETLSRITTVEDVTMRASLLRGVGCVRGSNQVSQVLDFATADDSGLSSSEALSALKSLMDNSADGCDTVLSYVQLNKDTIQTNLGVAGLRAIVLEIGTRIYNDDQLTKLKNIASADTSPAMADVLAVAQATRDWAGSNLRELKEWVWARVRVGPPHAPLLVTPTTEPTVVPPTAEPHPTEPPQVTNDWLLPADLWPDNYNLAVDVTLADVDTSSFTGTVAITLSVVAATNKIVLHSHESLTVSNARVVQANNNVPVAVVGTPDFEAKRQFLTINLQDQLQVGTKYIVSLAFTGPLKKDLAGLYLSTYMASNGVTSYMAVTQFEQTSARKAFPCFDEPKYRATFDVTITHPDTHGALSNMPRKSDGAAGNNKRKAIFETTPLMPTYLVVMLVSDLVEVKVDSRISIWVRADAKDEVGLATELAPKVLAKLEELTGIPYVLTKLDLAAIPDFAPGAMENWGLITFKDTVLRTPKNALAHRRFNCARDITHEFSHLWFGDLVTNNWWSSLWQQEGMAAFMEAWVLDQTTDSEYDAVARQSVDRIEQGLMDDALETAGAITNHTVGSPDEIEEHSGELTYNKGAGFLRMVKAMIGESTLWKGLRKYLQRHAFSTAGPDDLAAALQEAAGDDGLSLPVTIQEVMDSWTLQRGYPLLDVERYLNDDTYVVKQSRFLSYEPANATAVAAQQWLVPYHCEQLYSSGRRSFDRVLQASQETVPLPLQVESSITWIVCNTEQQGFYRVNYDQATWRYLGDALGKELIGSATQRGAILDDALTLMRARKTEPWVVMYVLERAAGDDTLPVWGAINKGVQHLRAVLADDATASEDLNTFVSDLTAETFGRVDWYNRYGWEESVQTNEVRQIVSRLACDAGEPLCVNSAVAERMESILPGYQIHPESFGAKNCLLYKDYEPFAIGFLLAQFADNSDYDQRLSLSYSMGCIVNSDSRDILLSGVHQGGFKSNEIEPFFESVLTHGGINEALNYLSQNWAAVKASLTDTAVALLQMAAERVHTQAQYDLVKQIADSDPSIYTTVAERSAANSLAFAQKELGQVKDYLAVYAGRKPAKPAPLVPTDYRLPGNVIPTSYDLTMIPYMDTANGHFYYEGSVVISATVQNDTDTIVLHKHKGLNVITYSVNNEAGDGEVGITDAVFHEASEMYTLLLTQPVTAGQQIVIGLEFTGKLLKDKLGFYLSDYPEGVKWKYMATTQFEQTYARKAFPCFDEPKYRATFNIRIARTENQIALSNMPISSTTDPDPDLGDRRMVTFQTTPPMPTYLVAFIVSELKKVPTSNPNINVYVRPDAEKHAALAADLAPKILAELESFTGVPYALPKLDLVAIPDFYFGAMENWGLITYRENRMLYDEQSATSEYKMFVAEVIAHEFVHLWFGDYVTLDWWSSGWLKEGFAEFLEHYVLERVMKSEGSSWYPLSRIGVEDVFDGMRDDALEHTEPLTDDSVATQDQIAEHMGLYTYTKGAGLHFMLMGLLGEGTYKAGLNKYLTNNKFGTATPERYATALQEAADANYTALPSGTTFLDVINSWSTKPGLPVITLIRNYDDNTVEASQSRYLAHEPSQESARDSKWIVPLSIFFNQGSPPKRATGYLLESQASASFFLGGTARNGVIFGNWLSRGYYYTNYDLLNWIRLGSAISNGHTLTDPIYRAGLIHDAFGLAKVSQLDPWVPLYLLEGDLIQEADAAPWIAAYNGLRSYAALAKGDPETDKMFQKYLRHNVAEYGYEFVTWDGFRGNVDGKVSRDYATKLACAVGYAPCRAKALQAYRGYFKDPASVDPNVLAATLCEGISRGTTLEYTALFEQLVAETERSRRMSIVYALGCLHNNTLVDQLLDLAGTMQGFEPQEVLPLFRSVLDNSPDGVNRAVDYVQANFDKLAASLGQSSAEGVVLTVAERAHTDSQYRKLKILQDISYSPKLVDAVAVADANVQWIYTHAGTLKDYLAAKLGVEPDAPAPQPAQPMPLPTASPATPTPGPGPTESPDSPAIEWRLPSSLAPQHYDLMMVPFLDNLTFTGKVTIKLLALEQTDTITLHARDLTFPNQTDEGFDNMQVYNAETANVIPVQDYAVHTEKNFLIINLATNLTANVAYNLSIQFGAPLRQDNFGFYVSSYIDNNEFKYMATTHFEATSARKAFPCFDEPRFRATFAISVARLPEQTALSNMPRIRTSGPDLDLDGRVWDDFETTPSMPTYLVAFIVHELKQVYTSASNVNVWVRPNAAADAGVAAEIAPQVIKAMGDFTAFKLPLPKVDLVAIPTFPIGAMENWGLVTFREDYIINPKKAKSEHAYSCASVVTHELSHLWFGDLVTIDWWSAAWLKEGMASFLELYMLDKADDDKYGGYKRILYEHVQPAMLVDSREGADILTNTTVGSPDEISDHMSTITYSKGGSFLRMMLTYVTENAFRAGLSRYINQNAYYWGTPEKLAAALQYEQDAMNPNKLGVSVQDMFDSWTTKPGFPVVTVIRDRVNGLATLSQRRFLSHEPTEDADMSSTWHVPFNVWVQGQDVPVGYTDVLLESETEKTILLDNTDFKLVLINAGQTGFYRVNYDLLTWIYVNLQLPRGTITSAETRAALIDDSFTLALARQLDSWVPLSVMQSGLPSETRLVPWVAARNALFRLRALLSHNDDAVGLLDRFVADLVTPTYTEVDWDMRWGGVEKYNVKLLRDLLTQLACTSGHELCLRSANFDFEGWYRGTLTVNPDTLAATLCEGMRTMPSGWFPVVWSRFLEEEDPTVRSAYLYGLGCHSANRDHVLLAATTHQGIKSNEAKHYFNSFLVHMEDGVEKLLTYMERNYATIKESVGVEATAAVLQLVADRISTKNQLNTIAALTAKDPCIEMTVVLQSAKSTFKWADEQLGLVIDFLQAADGDAPPAPTPSPAPTRPTLPTLAPPTNDSRLPGTVVPDDYTLKVIPYLSGDKMGTFEGQVTIQVHATEATNVIKLHAEGLDFSDDDVTIALSSQSAAAISYISRSSLYEWVAITLEEDLIEGASYFITVKYTGKFSSDLKGFFLSNDGGSTIAATKLAPTYARRLYPCFDEPSLRATFTVTVGRLDSEVVLSNTAVESTSSPDPSIGNRVLVTFKKTAKLPTHSITIVVSPGLQSATAPENMVSVYGTRKLVAKAQPTLAAAKDLLAILENITGTPSGLDSMAMVGVKDLLVDGTDNWAIDVIRNDALVKMDESPSAAEADIFWLTTVAHRLSQHWFGNLVSMAWWDNVWLTDGFATYFQYRAASQVKAAAGSDMLYPATFTSRVISPALAEDSLESAQALNDHYVYGTTAGIEKALSDIPTLKGGAIINSIPYILGSAAFESGLKAYMDSNNMSGVSPSALFAALQSGVDTHSVLPIDTDVATVLGPWVERAGYPVVTVSRDYDDDTAILAQERFLLHTPSGNADLDAAWWVPVSFATRTEYTDQYTTTPVRAWIKPTADLFISLPDQSASQWLVVNLDRKGFYRVNYDMKNWLLLARFMAEPGQHTVLEVPTRVMLLDDALTLARTGHLDYVTALQYADYLRAEDATHEVFATARDVFASNVETFVLGSRLDDVYKAWVGQLLSRAIANLGYAAQSSDKTRTGVARGIVMEWACDMDIAACTEPAQVHFNMWINDKDSVPHDTLASTVCAGVRNSSPDDYKQAVAVLSQETVDPYRQAIIRGLGCVANHTTAQSLMHLTVRAGLRGGEALEVFKSVSRFGPPSVDAALDYLVEWVIDVYRQAGMDGTEAIVSLVASRITTKAQNEKLNTIIAHMGSQQVLEYNVAQMLVADNLKWQGAHEDEVGDLLYALTGLPNPDLPDGPSTTAAPTTPTTTLAPTTRPTTRPTTTSTARPTQPPTRPSTSTAQPTTSTQEPSAASGVVANVLLLLASLVVLQRVAA
ncbi:uncharacterized protein LOC117650017 [Thrips palmi]|uniref:Uncharacterized protein LOC117650017 n=1 Tax=Thrips palmi TaxID=161013 RepID=A0A6P8ZV16_THRPL|nr:uncharacterized protein LOC117650017 [Thrips palmi]